MSRAGSRASRAAALVVLSALGGCILLVSPEEYGAACRFAGDETECGRCIATRCRSAVDGCCGDDTCQPHLDALDACSTGRVASCVTLAQHRASAQPTLAALATCFVTRCAAHCTARAPATSATRCTEDARGRGASCRCSLADAPNALACGPSTHPGTVCCAPKGWPAPGTECACLVIDCVATPDGCICTRAESAPETSACGGVHCCAAPEGCLCSPRPCQPGQREVPRCGRDVIGCTDDQIEVATCSFDAVSAR